MTINATSFSFSLLPRVKFPVLCFINSDHNSCMSHRHMNLSKMALLSISLSVTAQWKGAIPVFERSKTQIIVTATNISRFSRTVFFPLLLMRISLISEYGVRLV